MDVLPLLRAGLKDAGLLVVMVPNVLSLKGLVTRFTPFTARRWFYRLLGVSGDIDLASTVHSFSLRPASLQRYVCNGGWRLEYWRIYEGGTQRTIRHRLGVSVAMEIHRSAHALRLARVRHCRRNRRYRRFEKSGPDARPTFERLDPREAAIP